MGYVSGQKGYKLFDLDAQHLYSSRDVVFHEHILPYSISIANSKFSCPIPIPATFVSSPPLVPSSFSSQTDYASPSLAFLGDPIPVPFVYDSSLSFTNHNSSNLPLLPC